MRTPLPRSFARPRPVPFPHRLATGASAVDPLATIGALTLQNAGARTITGATDGTYQTYWDITGGVLKRNNVVGTPTAGTFTAGAKTITVEADTYDVGDGELQAVLNLSAATLSGKTIKILPGKDAGGTTIGSTATIATGKNLTADLVITSRDMTNPGYIRRLSVGHYGNGTVRLYGVVVRDYWKAGDLSATDLIGALPNTLGSVDYTRLEVDCCEVYSDTITAADLNPTPFTNVTSGVRYEIVTVATTNWTSIGGPATATVGATFDATSTNANISALGTVRFYWPHNLRLLTMESPGTNQRFVLNIHDSYFHDGSYGPRGQISDYRCDRNHFKNIWGNVTGQFLIRDTMTRWRTQDCWFDVSSDISSNYTGIHPDHIQLSLNGLTTAVTGCTFELIGNVFWTPGAQTGLQCIFFNDSTSANARVTSAIRENLILEAQNAGITVERWSASTEIRYNTVIFNQRSVGGLAPRINTQGTEYEAGQIRDNVSKAINAGALTAARAYNNLAFASDTSAAYDDALTATSFRDDDFATLSDFIAGMAPRVGGTADNADATLKRGAGWFYTRGTPAPSYSKSGLPGGTFSPPTYRVPDTITSFTATDAQSGLGVDIVITPPHDGGQYITAYEYKVDSGSWTSSGGTSASFRIPGAAFTMGVVSTVYVRAVNSVGNGATSSGQSVTPTNTFSPVSAAFDGSTMYWGSSTGQLSAPISETGALSMWFKHTAGTWAANQQLFQLRISGGTIATEIYTLSSGRLLITSAHDGTGGSQSAVLATSSLVINQWYCLMLSWRRSTATWQCYINGSVPSFGTNFAWKTGVTAMVGEGSTMNRGGIAADNAGNGKFQGEIAYVWFDNQNFVDWSSSTNRDKFISAGSPVNLGSDGSTPFGWQPQLYYYGSGNSMANYGSATGFTKNGTLTAGSTPSV